MGLPRKPFRRILAQALAPYRCGGCDCPRSRAGEQSRRETRIAVGMSRENRWRAGSRDWTAAAVPGPACSSTATIPAAGAPPASPGCATSSKRRKRRTSSASTYRSACPSVSATRDVRPTARRGRCSVASAPACSRCRRGRRSTPRITRRPRPCRARCPSRPSPPRSSAGTSSGPSRRWTRSCGRSRTSGRGFTRCIRRSPSSASTATGPWQPGRRRRRASPSAGGCSRRRGLAPALVASSPPPGVAADDHVDAMAALVVARDIAEGRAMPLPPDFEHDAEGLPVVIWAPASGLGVGLGDAGIC